MLPQFTRGGPEVPQNRGKSMVEKHLEKMQQEREAAALVRHHTSPPSSLNYRWLWRPCLLGAVQDLCGSERLVKLTHCTHRHRSRSSLIFRTSHRRFGRCRLKRATGAHGSSARVADGFVSAVAAAPVPSDDAVKPFWAFPKRPAGMPVKRR